MPDPVDPVRKRSAGTILVVDRDRGNLGTLGRRLAQLGFTAVLSDTGTEALDLVAARALDLVLLDTLLPDVSAWQVLRGIRDNRATADLPVIMLTARDDPADAVEVLAAADDLIARPFAFEVLGATIHRVLGRARRIAELKRANAATDAYADHQRLVAPRQVRAVPVDRLSGTSVPG